MLLIQGASHNVSVIASAVRMENDGPLSRYKQEQQDRWTHDEIPGEENDGTKWRGEAMRERYT